MKKCPHQFFKITEVRKITQESLKEEKCLYGVQVACVLCGEVRTAWDNGEVEIKEGKKHG